MTARLSAAGVARPAAGEGVMSGVPHGTAGGYTNRGCRCPRCREANRLAQAAWRAGPHDPAMLRHGERSTYANQGCRCAACREAHRLYAAARRQARAS